VKAEAVSISETSICVPSCTASYIANQKLLLVLMIRVASNGAMTADSTNFTYSSTALKMDGPGSSVGIGTGYRLDSPGIETRWERDLPHLSRPALGPTQRAVEWVLVYFRG
jgi:hypothetical protein